MTDAFAPVHDLFPMALSLRNDIDQWMPEYLAAVERQQDLELLGDQAVEVGDSPNFATLAVRHAPFIRTTDKLPVLVVWIAGVTDHERSPDGQIHGTVQIGVLLAVGGNEEIDVAQLLHRYVAATRALLIDRPTCAGHCRRLELVDEDYAAIDPEERGRTLAAVGLSYNALGVNLGARGSLPLTADPREDPLPPWPLGPTVETTHLTGPDPMETP